MAKVDIPQPIETVKKDVVWYGLDNLYPEYLISLYNKSPKLQSMLSTIADFISGQGFDDSNEAINTFIANPFNKETLQEILPKIALDLVIYGAYTLNIIWSKDGKSISQIKYINIAKFRFNKEIEYEDTENGVQYCWLCSDWKNERKNPAQRYQLFDGVNREEKSQIAYFYKYSPNMSYYAAPFWSASSNWAELDFQIGNFHLQNAINGYTPSLHINVATGEPTPEEQADFKRKLDTEYKGTDNASKILLSFSEGQDKATTVTPIQLNDSDKRYEGLQDQIIQNILIAGKATASELFGIKSAAGLAAKADLVEALDVYKIKVVKSFQDIINKGFIKMLKINGVSEPITIKPYSLDNQQ
ncbi:MAG: hypothetical protein ACKOW9_03190 [Candidatus Paceibacterota bacterium]